MSKDYGSWTLANLKAELRKRKAKVTGKKAILAKRLHDYDMIFGPVVNDPVGTYKIKMPEHKMFRDINADTVLPILTQHDIDVFCKITNRSDNENAQKMYEEGFLLTVRSTSEASLTYVIATCASEMRKSVTYSMNVVYTEKLIQETECECAAGQGPYAQCKHVLIALYGLKDFSTNKKIKIRLSTTSTIQTFHQPSRFYTGEPVEAKNLTLKGKDRTRLCNFDPRPSKESVEKYRETFGQKVKNYMCTYKVQLPISILDKAGNKKALYDDHDYLEHHKEVYFLQSLILSRDQIKELQIKTLSDKNLWKQERLRRLQSSNYGRICKSKDETKTKLAKSLLKSVDITSPAIKHGLKMESKAIEKFSAITKIQTIACGIVVHPSSQYLASVPDRLIGDDAVLEVKCPFTAYQQMINSESVPYIYLCEKTGGFLLKEDHDYYYQVQGQLLCTNRQKAYFCIYTELDTLIIEINRDNNFINNMYNKLQHFYEYYYKEQFLNRYLYNIKI